jgi:hypothetical protein
LSLGHFRDGRPWLKDERRRNKQEEVNNLDLGYVYEIADSLGISHAREKAIENFKVYCKYKSSDRACSLLDK